LEQNSYILFRTMQLHDRQVKRLYLSAEERPALIAAAADRPVRLCHIYQPGPEPPGSGPKGRR
jgi:hypothetical protein